MDPLLEQRYLALFGAYGVGEPDELVELKLRLLQALLSKFLRPDAALCLLALYDQMIFRPYASTIVFPSERLPSELSLEALPAPSVGRNRIAFRETMQASLSSIFQQLEDVQERPISSHQVLRAIDRAWPDLTVMFGWG
jgi:hypothetical protein